MSGPYWVCKRGHQNFIPAGREHRFLTKCERCPDPPTVAYWIEPLGPERSGV